MTKDRKADRHIPGHWHPVSARLGDEDFTGLEDRRKALGISRRQAIISAIRDWTARTTTSSRPDPEDQQ